MKAKNLCCTWRAYAETHATGQPIKRFRPQFLSALSAAKSKTESKRLFNHEYNRCDTCGMDDRSPEIMVCECFKEAGGETVSCRTCIDSNELTWLDAAVENC